MNTSLAQVREGKVNFQKTQQPAAIVDMPYPSSVVDRAIEHYLGSKGAKGKDYRGFKTFKNVKLEDTVNNDLYFKVERKSQNESTVYLFIAPANQDVLTRNTESSEGVQQARELLNSLTPAAEASSLDVKLKDQEEAVSRAEKKLRSLMDDAADLTKRKANIEEKITENQQAQQKQKLEIEKQRQELSNLINKKRS